MGVIKTGVWRSIRVLSRPVVCPEIIDTPIGEAQKQSMVRSEPQGSQRLDRFLPALQAVFNIISNGRFEAPASALYPLFIAITICDEYYLDLSFLFLHPLDESTCSQGLVIRMGCKDHETNGLRYVQECTWGRELV
jgi:hypothetical protein